VGYVNSTLDYSRDLHSKNMSSFAAAKESAYGFVEGYVNATKAALDPKVYVDRATALGKTLVDAVVEYTDPDKLVALATATYDTLVTKTPGAFGWWGGGGGNGLVVGRGEGVCVAGLL